MSALEGKVVAYITRWRQRQLELLVFSDPQRPEFGYEVPAGTVEPGEHADAATMREIVEESGLSGLRLVRRLGEFVEPEWNCVRHVYWYMAEGSVADSWQRQVDPTGVNGEALFTFHWVTLKQARERLGWQARWLDALANS